MSNEFRKNDVKWKVKGEKFYKVNSSKVTLFIIGTNLEGKLR